jgi:hypothetical protein
VAVRDPIGWQKKGKLRTSGNDDIGLPFSLFFYFMSNPQVPHIQKENIGSIQTNAISYNHKNLFIEMMQIF